MKTVGALLIAGTAGSAVILSVATQWGLAVYHRCQRSRTATTQRLLPAEATRLFNQHKAAAPWAVRVAGEAAATGGCGP